MRYLIRLMAVAACVAFIPSRAEAGHWQQSQGYWYYQDDAGNWYVQEKGNYFIWSNGRWEFYPPWSKGYTESVTRYESGYRGFLPSYDDGDWRAHPAFGYPYDAYPRSWREISGFPLPIRRWMQLP